MKVASREYATKESNGFWYYCVSVSVPTTSITAVASSTSVAPSPWLAGAPRPQDYTQTNYGTIGTVVTSRCPLSDYIDNLVRLVAIQKQIEEDSKQRDRLMEIASDVALVALFIALPELLPGIPWMARVATLMDIGTTLVVDGVEAAAASQAMDFLFTKGVKSFTDITSGVMRQVIVEGAKTGVTYGYKSAFSNNRPMVVSAEAKLSRIHYFLWEADPTYPERWTKMQEEWKKDQRAKRVLSSQTSSGAVVTYRR